MTHEIVMDKVWQLVVAERQRQIAKWGRQTHPDGDWSLILTEELGEASRSLLAGDHLAVVEELVQSAAVIMAWIEDKLDNGGDAGRDPS